MSDAAKPEKGSQKMVVSGLIILPPGNFFETAKRADVAREVLEDAATKVAEHFPGFKFSVDVSPWREHSGGRRSAAATAAAAAATAAGAVDGATAAASNGEAVGNGEASGAWPPAGSEEGYQGTSAAESEAAPAVAAASGRQSARQAAR